MKKYLLIDGNNLACRSAFANATLQNSEGIYTGVHYGTIRSLLKFKNMFKDYIFLVAWDGKSRRRMYDSQKGVDSGIIPGLYKGNRDLAKPEIINLHEQRDYLIRGIDTLGISQIFYPDYEADDILCSYVNKLGKDNEIVIITSDNDYFQLLSPNVRIYDDMKKTYLTYESFFEKTGLVDPQQHVHVGALMGDAGDNIYGVPGWGIKTAIQEIKEHHTCFGVLDYYNNAFSKYRESYPDLDDLDELMTYKHKNDISKYKEVNLSCPYTGVALAKEKGDLKISQAAVWILLFQKRVHLAYSLKKMDVILDIPDIPEYVDEKPNEFDQYLEYYEMESLRTWKGHSSYDFDPEL